MWARPRHRSSAPIWKRSAPRRSPDSVSLGPPDFLVADALESGRLVQVLPSETTNGTFWLLWPPGRHSSPRLRAFLDFAKSWLL
ncbi:LysR substrate-binding domain-containing protein [Bradyrhizobium sp. STM 3562]|uniref:LysR substrate-binding domain-containing protein n=1 Tax=Bradyrhizobium sp. STM 3562 TaxID=578924 RepID=UPI00388D5E5E